MMQRNFLIVGFGSMGKRRARLLQGIDENISISVTDSNPERREQAKELGYCPFEDMETALATGTYTAALVCAAPLAHTDICETLLAKGISIFCELNLNDDGYPHLKTLSEQNGALWFCSNTMLYRGETQQIKQLYKQHDKPVNYSYHIGQYLPDWHPWESYKQFFVGDKATSGIREILAIELAWLTETFDEVQDIHVQKRRVSDLEISYEDAVFIVLTHKSGTIGLLQVDVVSPKAVRRFGMTGQGIYVTWDGSPDSLYRYDADSKQMVNISVYEKAKQLAGYSDNIVENAYTAELNNFLSALEGIQQPRYGYEHNLSVLKLIQSIEE